MSLACVSVAESGKADLRLKLVVLFLCLSGGSIAQSELDSLKRVLKTTVDRTERFGIQYEIGSYYHDQENYDSAVIAYTKAAEIAPKNDLSKSADALRGIARCYRDQEKLTAAIKYYGLSYQAYLKGGAQPDVTADVMKDLGRCFYDMAKYDSAMYYYMAAKEIYETNHIENEDYGVLHHYIGSVYKRQEQMDKACEYYQKEIEYGQKHNFERVYAEGLYLSSSCMENDTLSLRNDLKVMRIYEEMGDDRKAGLMYGNVALSYQSIGMLDSALFWMRICLYQKRKDGEKSSLSGILSDIGNLLVEMNRFGEAIPYFEEAENLAHQTDLKKYLLLKDVYSGFYEVNYRLKKFREAIEYLDLYYAYKDSARDLDHQNAIDKLVIEYETEKKEAEIALLEKESEMQERENVLAKEEAASEKKTRNLFMIGGLILLALGIYTFIKLRETQRQKVIISVQKKEVEYQKELVDVKNKDITDSITYASSIQKAIITADTVLSEMFTDAFVLYRPRDIVSGDFYWAHTAPDGKKLIAVGDCTGHGVPGAMMSMLGTAFLDDIVVESGETNPGKILNKLRDAVKKAMSKGAGRDGMDMSLCVLDGQRLYFAGANLPLYILRQKEIIELKGDKQPLGHQPAGEKPFGTQTMELNKGDRIYLFSDGFADQFGGPRGKKFKYSALREKLCRSGEQSAKLQMNYLEAELNAWKGDLEQVDDICVVGIHA